MNLNVSSVTSWAEMCFVRRQININFAMWCVFFFFFLNKERTIKAKWAGRVWLTFSAATKRIKITFSIACLH